MLRGSMNRAVVLCTVLAQGCAVGYGVGTTSAHVGKGTDVPQAQTWSTTYQEFRVIDTTGLALAAIVNAGRQYNARNEAMEEANRQAAVAQPGETVRVEYSWEPMPILAGLLTDVRIRVPLATPGLELDGVDAMQDVEYWGFNVRPEFYTFRALKSLPMVSSLYLSVDVENWKSHQPMNALLTENDVVSMDMDFGASTSYVVGENLTATGRLALGVLSPILGLLSPDSSKLNPSLEVEVGYRPWHSEKLGVVVSGLAYLGREFIIENPGRTMWSPRVGLNVALTFGNQVPKKVRQARPPTETQPPAGADTTAGSGSGSGSISGNVCLGDSPAPECAQVANKAPETVKVLWLACVQSTMKVAESKQLGTQPHDCRVAGDGIANLIKTGPGQPITADDQRLMRIAAAGAYDLSAAGYESMEKLGKDHCASVEATFNFVVGPDANSPVLPTKVKVVDDAVTQCRQKYTCTADAAGVVACQDKAAPVPASAPTPAPATPAPATPAPATSAPATPAPAGPTPATLAPSATPAPAPAAPAPGAPAPAPKAPTPASAPKQ